MSITVVTAIYNLSEYVGQVFPNLLAISTPMVIFIPPPYQDSDQISKFLQPLLTDSTLVVEYARQDLPNNQPYVKYYLLNEVITGNFFQTDYYLWVEPTLLEEPLRNPWPDYYKIRLFEDKLVVLQKSSHRTVDTSIIGGRRKILDRLHHVLSTTTELPDNDADFLEKSSNDSSIQLLRYPVDQPSQFLRQLAEGTLMAINYPVCPNLKLLTVATREVSDEKIQRWRDSAEYFGYDYEILGREDQWDGWTYRTKKYLDRVKQIQDDYSVVILLDATDAFLTGSSWEAYQKFQRATHQYSSQLVIGSENGLFYVKGQFNKFDIIRDLIQRCQSCFCFPNGGFVMGVTRPLIRLLELNQDATDDQAGYIDIIHQGATKLALDEETIFVGNITCHTEFPDFWRWDSVKCRYYNPHSGEYPIAIHFPGKNMKPFTEMFNRVFQKDSEVSKRTRFSCYLFIGLIIVGILAVICYWLS